ncbi:MAG: DUF1565 domain-containing protein [Candidatus Hydrogenedens sp.]|nr:DUF1565 domain-containing protein [Candidatus Hydrogenedens sp.]
MLRWPILAAAVLAAAAPFAASADPGDVFYVDADNQSGVENGLSWATAHRTVAAGIETARRNFGGDVWVAEGVYDETRDATGGSLVLVSGVNLYGGFAGTETLRAQRNPLTHPAIIDGSSANAGAPAAPVVVGVSGAALDGFTVQGGRGEVGAGLILNEISPTIANCVFTDNETTGFGGAVICIGAASPRFVNCVFTNNRSAKSGGAVTNTGATPSFEGCLFSLNEAAEAGGAIFNTPGSDILVTDCTFERNTAQAGGGAIFNEGASPSLTRSTFLRNSSGSFGGAIFNNFATDAGIASDVLATNCVFAKNTAVTGGGAISTLGSSFTAVNCTIADNTAPETGGGAFFNNDADTEVLNSIIWYNSDGWIENYLSFTEIRWSNVGGGDRGPNNIAREPRFADRANDDYSLLPDSPSIDAGTASGAPAVDIRGVARPQFDGVDQGAYEALERTLPEGMNCHDANGQATTADGLTLLAACMLLAGLRASGARRR